MRELIEGVIKERVDRFMEGLQTRITLQLKSWNIHDNHTAKKKITKPH